jgi:hypothetical protein
MKLLTFAGGPAMQMGLMIGRLPGCLDAGRQGRQGAGSQREKTIRTLAYWRGLLVKCEDRITGAGRVNGMAEQGTD